MVEDMQKYKKSEAEKRAEGFAQKVMKEIPGGINIVR